MQDETSADTDRDGLTILLCTRLGMLMEDLIPVALDVSPHGLADRAGYIAQGVRAMTAIAEAAVVLSEI